MAWIGDAQGPARKDEPAPIEDSPVCLLAALVGLEDEIGTPLGIAEESLPERPERVAGLHGVNELEHPAVRRHLVLAAVVGRSLDFNADSANRDGP